MGMSRAEMFNRRAASPEFKPDEILRVLGLKRGQTVADIGSGGGYYTLRFAEAVGEEGKVFAVDTNREYLDFIGGNASKAGLGNIELVRLSGAEPPIHDGSCDLIFLRNVYHHLEDRVELMGRYRRKLAPSGRIAVVEYRKGSIFSSRGLFGHYVARGVIVEEMQKAGFQLIEEHEFLPEQSFTVYAKGNPVP